MIQVSSRWRGEGAEGIRRLAEELPSCASWEECSCEDAVDSKGPGCEEVYRATVAVCAKSGSARLSLVARCVEWYGNVLLSVTCEVEVPPRSPRVQLLHLRFDYLRDTGHAADLDRSALAEVAKVLVGNAKDTEMALQVLWCLLCAPLAARPRADEVPLGLEITYRRMGVVFDRLVARRPHAAGWRGASALLSCKVPRFDALSRYLMDPP